MDSPFVSRLLAQDAWSRGGDQGGSSSHSSLGVRLHHGGHRLRGAECAGDGAGDKALGQNDTWATGRGTEGLSSQRAAQWEKLTDAVWLWSYRVLLQPGPAAAAE